MGKERLTSSFRLKIKGVRGLLTPTIGGVLTFPIINLSPRKVKAGTNIP